MECRRRQRIVVAATEGLQWSTPSPIGIEGTKRRERSTVMNRRRAAHQGSLATGSGRAWQREAGRVLSDPKVATTTVVLRIGMTRAAPAAYPEHNPTRHPSTRPPYAPRPARTTPSPRVLACSHGCHNRPFPPPPDATHPPPSPTLSRCTLTPSPSTASRGAATSATAPRFHPIHLYGARNLGTAAAGERK